MSNYESIERQPVALSTAPGSTDASEDKRHRRSNVLVAVYTLLACSGALYFSRTDRGSALAMSLVSGAGDVLVSGGSDDSSDAVVTKDTTKVGVDSGGNYSCFDYDDDGTFTPELCSTYDWNTCFGGFRGGENKTNCNSSFWCNTLCADMCDEGAGAMCYYERLSNLSDTCGHVKRILHSKNYVERRSKWEAEHVGKAWGDDGDDYMDSEELIFMPMPDTTETTETSETSAVSETSAAALTGYGVTDELSDEGCGRHVYCHYCNDDCVSDELVDWIHDAYYDRVSPYSTKQALIDIEQICTTWGYLPHKGDDDI